MSNGIIARELIIADLKSQLSAARAEVERMERERTAMMADLGLAVDKAEQFRTRLKTVEAGYEKYKHLDKVLTDPIFKTGEISIDIKQDLWAIIKSAALSPEPPKPVCEWTKEASKAEYDVWIIGCTKKEHTFEDCSPTSDGKKYCPYCGLKIVEKPGKEGDA
jgi:hypothetical protein